MVGLVAAEPLPLPERLTLLGDLLAFEGKLTIRRRTEPARKMLGGRREKQERAP